MAYKDGSTVVTSKVTGGTYQTLALESGLSKVIKLTATANKSSGTLQCKVTAAAVADPSAVDTVMAKPKATA